MSQNNHRLFTIGQFASLHQINKKTLMWYDETGLFRPAVVKENGYRYYTYQQCTTLETILMLRELDVSIAEIKLFLNHRSADSLHTVFSEKTDEIDSAIQHLLQIKKALLYQKKELKHLQSIDLSSIQIIHKQERKLVFLKTPKNTPPEKEAEMVFHETHRHKAYRMYGILYGSIIPVTSLYRHDFEDYQGIFLQIPEAELTSNVHIQPAGSYLRAYCKGNWDKLPKKYCEILQYAAAHHIKLQDYAYETGLNEMICNSMDDYITQIEIPVSAT